MGVSIQEGSENPMLISRTTPAGPIAADRAQLPEWAEWTPSTPYSVGIEEEVMVLDPATGSLARDTDHVLTELPLDLAAHVRPETHQAAAELGTSPHLTAEPALREAIALRQRLLDHLDSHGLTAAAAGTHPMALWTDVQVSRAARYQLIYDSMRELARREPTFALHVHVGVSDPDDAVLLANRLRVHLPLLLALSANSPFWQRRDSGLASARIPIFQAFPRVGIPRAFGSYDDYIETIDLLVRCGAIPEPTFLWWDVRLQPRLGTVEVRVMDVQTTTAATGALLALVQSLSRLELEEGYATPDLISAHEVLAENRFLAARDGMEAALIDPVAGHRVPARRVLDRLLMAARSHAEDLGCASVLDGVVELADRPGAACQRQKAARSSLPELMQWLVRRFVTA